MDKTLVLSSGAFIAVATIGFLFISGYLDRKIRSLRSHVEEKHAKQRDVYAEMRNSNSHSFAARQIVRSIMLLKAVGGNEDDFVKLEEERLAQARSMASSLVNALAAVGHDQAKGQKDIDWIDQAAREDLDQFYRTNMPMAAAATTELQREMEISNTELARLESITTVVWSLCFVCQSAGMVLGLCAVVFKA